MPEPGLDLDEDKPAAAPAPAPTTLTVAKDIERDSFVETFNVRERGRRYEVAANAIANRALMQMNVAKLRVLCERAIKPYIDTPDLIPSAKDLKVLTDAFQTVDSMSDMAYSDRKGGGGSLANSLERLVYAATKGAAAGAAAPGSHSPEARMKRLNAIGKKAPAQQEPIDVTPQ